MNIFITVSNISTTNKIIEDDTIQPTTSTTSYDKHLVTLARRDSGEKTNNKYIKSNKTANNPAIPVPIMVANQSRRPNNIDKDMVCDVII
jgi:hypothetical protein